MTSLAHLRRTALALPRAEEGTHFGMVAFRVAGKGFASVTGDGLVHLNLPEGEASEMIAQHPTADRLTRGDVPLGVRIPLTDLDGQQLNYWLRRSWLSRAPRRLAAEIAAADRATPGEVGDLPASIGVAATRALAAAGITELTQIADHRRADLLALHGVGPKAVRLLGEALAERGLDFR